MELEIFWTKFAEDKLLKVFNSCKEYFGIQLAKKTVIYENLIVTYSLHK
jgi:hypothetical protein